MKYFISFLFTGFLFVSPNTAEAQEISCDQFCVEQIQMDTLNPGQMIITIYFSGDNNDFINYPHVDFVLDQQGDTIGDGDLAFFGQFGMTRQDYYVFTSLAAIPANFHPTIYFRYDDTICPLNYPCTTSFNATPESNNAISLSPNPVHSEMNIELGEALKDVTMIIYDSQGRRVEVVPNLTGQYIWHRGNLAEGMYYLQFIDGGKLIDMKKVLAIY